MEEQFKVIKGFEHYAVSSDGRVLNMKYDRFLKIGTFGRCWRRVTLTRPDGVRVHFTLHRLVAEYFLEDYDENYKVEHLNDDPNDNRAANLKMADVCVRLRSCDPLMSDSPLLAAA